MSSFSKSETLLSTDKLNLVYSLNIHKTVSLRDGFVQAVGNPLSLFNSDRDRLHVLKDISFKLNKGDRLGLIGLNGAGKTSLCRVISGLIRPNSGKITANGKVRAIFDTGVGIVPELTGRENAQLLSKFIFDHHDDSSELLEEALSFSELGPFLDVPLRTYSRGMKARLCLSLISATSHDILILDEVFSGADKSFSKKVEKRVLRMIENSGAVIFVSHSTEQMKRVCNRALLLDGGHLRSQGSVDEVADVYDEVVKDSKGFSGFQ